jgi:hypothetical protein
VKQGTRAAKIVRAVVDRILFYGSILLFAWWWMLWTPGSRNPGPVMALTASEVNLESQLRSDVDSLAGKIGDRNVPGKAKQLDQAAGFVDQSLTAAGYQPKSQWYRASRNRIVVGADDHHFSRASGAMELGW